MLQTQGVCKKFGDIYAVHGVSLTIPAGQMVGIIGRSGAGKSTLLRLLHRLVDPTHGRITCDGIDVGGLKGRALRAWRAQCAMIFQQFHLVHRLDVITKPLPLVEHRGVLKSKTDGDERHDPAGAVAHYLEVSQAPFQPVGHANLLARADAQRHY